MTASPSSREPLSRRPLATLGTVFLLVMLIPLTLYPLAPDEPVSVGDRVLAEGKQTVALADPGRYHALGYKTSCVLEPHDRVVILRMPQQSSADQTILGQRDSGPEARPQFPFCPPQAEVLLLPHQIIKKERLSVLIKETVRRLAGL